MTTKALTLPASLTLAGGLLFWINDFTHYSAMSALHYTVAACVVLSFLSVCSKHVKEFFPLVLAIFFTSVPLVISTCDSFFRIDLNTRDSNFLKAKIGLVFVLLGTFASFILSLLFFLYKFGQPARFDKVVAFSLIPLVINVAGCIVLFSEWVRVSVVNDNLNIQLRTSFFASLQAFFLGFVFFLAFVWNCRELHLLCLYVTGYLFSVQLPFALDTTGFYPSLEIASASLIWSSMVLYGLGTSVYLNVTTTTKPEIQPNNPADPPQYRLLTEEIPDGKI